MLLLIISAIILLVYSLGFIESMLGENPALQQGSNLATGKWLLFMDADVIMAENTLLDAVVYVEENKLDHLALLPQFNRSGFLLNIMLASFLYNVLVAVKPWQVRNPSSKKSVGVGAFNLVKAAVYKETGGHASLALNTDDDIKLGKLLGAERLIHSNY